VRQYQHKQTNNGHGDPAEQAKALAAALEGEFGVPFTLFDAASGTPIGSDSPAEQPQTAKAVSLDPTAVLALVKDGLPRLTPLPGDRYQLALLLYAKGQPVFVAAAEIHSLAEAGRISIAAKTREQAMLDGWLQAVSDRLRLADQLLSRRHAEEAQHAQATRAWEALLTLDQAARGLRMDKDPARNRTRILEAAFTSLPVRAFIWVPREEEKPILWQGEKLLTQDECRQMVRILSHSPDFEASAPLLCNQPDATRWGPRFPQIDNLMAFALTDRQPGGWFLALNKRDGGPFRLTDAALLLPFLALLELHGRWSHRYQDRNELLVGLARALTAALDAKDTYTFGHSERVARIAVELGRELQLDADQLGDIYLAGLLHDVGKIGIRDTVLNKTQALSLEEQEHIQEHVTIGYAILADLRQIRNLLPGVLYHHERYDGRGYPDGLAGEEIPLLARILAVADAYDAMSHPRAYRDAMPNPQVEEVLVRGAGSQWDKRIVDAFCHCRQQIYTIRQRGVGDSLRVAIDGALRSFSTPRRPVIKLEPLQGIESANCSTPKEA
jgi:HD-GYP domain-containing protein (c-di-GMP phosphodiesterase class II)